MEEPIVGADNSNTAEQSVELDTTEANVEANSSTEESVEEIKARLAKAEELANNYKIRAEKAERNVKKEEPKQATPKANAQLSTTDVYALMKAGVEEEDISEVEAYAQFKKISVSDALKSSVVKATLAERKENRDTAKATNTGSTKRPTGKVSDETLVRNAEKMELPDSSDDIQRLYIARMKNRG